jgi:hypothetical protein
MGKPTWVLVQYSSDWRWGVGSPTTPWYSSIKIFRQSDDINWAPVLDRVKEELINYK